MRDFSTGKKNRQALASEPGFFYFTSVPPHSTTVNPFLSTGCNSGSDTATGLSIALNAMNARITLSGFGLTSSLAVSVYISVWNVTRLYSFFCSLGSQYSMNSLYSFLFSPIFGRTFSKNASASQPFTTYPFDQSYSVLSVDSQKIYLYVFPLALSVSFPPGSVITCHSPLPFGIDCVNRPSVSVSLTVTSVVFVGYR